MLGRLLILAAALALARPCPNDAVSMSFLDYLDQYVLLPCETSQPADNRTALIQCIKITYHTLKTGGFHGNFSTLSAVAMNTLEGYFQNVAIGCWNNNLSHEEYNDCIADTYYDRYDYKKNTNGSVSKEFLDYLKCNVLISCESKVPAENRTALIGCIKTDYHSLKTAGKFAQFGLNTTALDVLENYFAGVAMGCWNDDLSHSQFNLCVGDEYYQKYGFNKHGSEERKLLKLLARFLRNNRA